MAKPHTQGIRSDVKRFKSLFSSLDIVLHTDGRAPLGSFFHYSEPRRLPQGCYRWYQSLGPELDRRPPPEQQNWRHQRDLSHFNCSEKSVMGAPPMVWSGGASILSFLQGPRVLLVTPLWGQLNTSAIKFYTIKFAPFASCNDLFLIRFFRKIYISYSRFTTTWCLLKKRILTREKRML